MNNDLLDALAKPPPPPSELDELIARDPLDLTADDIDKIIAMERSFRAKKAAGEIKTTRSRKAAAPADPADRPSLDALLALVPKAAPPKPTAAPTAVPNIVRSFRRI